jgi:NAD(P)-dependent dehydrogenase (short-subunit alcohol dehydrogenase family)
MPKTWFITGASRGFGRIWAEAALARGDRVAATARDESSLAELKARYGDAVLPLALDVTHAHQAKHAVERAHEHFSGLDVVINNAGYTLVGTVEEASAADVRALFETNYFGMLHVIQAAVPLLRAQGRGHIVGVSSTLGIVAMPLIGFYSATKWAVESLHESLAGEVKPFGIKVTLVEPGAYATDFGSPASMKQSEAMDIYKPLRERVLGSLRTQPRGEPQATAEAILKMVDAPEPPLRFILGDKNLPLARGAYADRLATWESWEQVSKAAQGAPQVG